MYMYTYIYMHTPTINTCRSQSAVLVTISLFVCHIVVCIVIGSINSTSVWNGVLQLAACIPATIICYTEEEKDKTNFATVMAIRFASEVSFCYLWVSFVRCGSLLLQIDLFCGSLLPFVCGLTVKRCVIKTRIIHADKKVPSFVSIYTNKRYRKQTRCVR